jgi:hypothetical protein
MAEFEKRAWWNLCVAVSAVVLFAALWMVTRKPHASTGAFGLLGLSGFPFFRLRPPASDERDREIDRRSSTVAMGLFWLLFVAAGVGPGFALGWDAVVRVPVFAFSQIIMGGWIVILTAKSAASIRMYRAG